MQSKREDHILALSKNQGIVLDKPRLVKFVTLDARLRTYDVWSDGERLAEALAQAGFLFKTESCVLICFHCESSVEIEEVLTGADPWIIHIQKFPHCAHVRHCKGDKFVIDILKGAKVSSQCEALDSLSLVIASNQSAFEAAVEIYTDEAVVRKAVQYLVTKKDQKKFTGLELAAVIEDVHNLQGADPPEVVPDCKVNEVLEDVTTLQEENDQLSEKWKCKICFSGDACIIILPCGHMSTCPQCISALTKCPICRQLVKGTVRAMFARSSAACAF